MKNKQQKINSIKKNKNMKVKNVIPEPDENIEFKLHEDILIFRIIKNVYDEITDASKSERFLKLLQSAKSDNDVKAILIYNEPDSLGDTEYDRFLRSILSKDIPGDYTGTPNFCERSKRYKEINILNRLINAIVDTHKIVVSGLQGEVVTPFFGVSLATDMRFASEDMNYYLSHARYGLHPSGALPFFLSRYLHHSMATEILIKGGKISAKKALNLGLITKTIDDKNFEQGCIKRLKKYTDICHSSLRNTKRLINFQRRELEDYFEYEASILNL